MLARLEHPLLHLYDPILAHAITFDVGVFDEVEQYFMGPLNQMIAISGTVSGGTRLYAADLFHKELRLVYVGPFYDFNWFNEEHVILYTGTHLLKVNVVNGEAELLTRISRVSMAPMKLSANPASTRIIGVNPYDKPFVYTVGEKEVQKIDFRIWDYCWLNEEEILYSYQNGLRRYHCATGEKTNFLINFSQLRKIPGFQEFCREYSIQDCDDLSLTAPQYLNGKIYFRAGAFFSEKGSVSALLSVDLGKSKGDVLFVSENEPFAEFAVLADGEVLSILGIRQLANSETGCQTMIRGEVLERVGYYPVLHPGSMSTLSLYQRYYEPD